MALASARVTKVCIMIVIFIIIITIGKGLAELVLLKEKIILLRIVPIGDDIAALIRCGVQMSYALRSLSACKRVSAK